jgi:hypothetical protein
MTDVASGASTTLCNPDSEVAHLLDEARDALREAE